MSVRSELSVGAMIMRRCLSNVLTDVVLLAHRRGAYRAIEVRASKPELCAAILSCSACVRLIEGAQVLQRGRIPCHPVAILNSERDFPLRVYWLIYDIRRAFLRSTV
jgi:hypothetical protein